MAYRIALNESRRHRTRHASVSLEAVATRADPSAQTAESAIADVEADRLHGLIAQLPDRERESIVLHYLQGLDVKAIASLLGCPENTVKTHLFRGRAHLREMWGKER